MKKRIISFLSVLYVLSLVALSVVSCKEPIPPPPPPRQVSFIDEWTPLFNHSDYELTHTELTLTAKNASTFLNNSIYREITGTSWTVTVKLTGTLEGNQLAGFALALPTATQWQIPSDGQMNGAAMWESGMPRGTLKKTSQQAES